VSCKDPGVDGTLGTGDDVPGAYDVAIATTLVQVGLILVEFTVTDPRAGTVLSRLATYRSGEY
jgi:hypothetical protein